MIVRRVCCILLALGASAAASAAERVLTLDPQATSVTFLLAATAHKVHGTLHLESGEVRFDPATGVASGEIALDARLAETGNEKRDRKMHEVVLESARFPRIVFRPTRFEGTLAGGEAHLVGTLTLHGDEHPLTLVATVQIDGERVKATSTFAIPYVEWGLEDPSVFVLRVAKSVEVTVEAVGSLR